MTSLRLLTCALTAFLTGSDPVAAAPPADSEPAYRQEIEAFRKDRETGLRQEDGWFTLVGLFWLAEGRNRFGSDPGNTVILPEGKSPAVAGTLVRQGDEVRVEVDKGATVTSGGKPVTEMVLRKDVDRDPTVLELGSLRFFVIQRSDRIGVRVRDGKAAALAEFKGLDYFPIDPVWRVSARFEPSEPGKTIAIPNVLGQILDLPSPGALVFERGGKTYRIDALGSVEDGLSLLFADATSGKETYGGGRFLETDGPKDGTVVIDFNRAYNPPCAFSAFATCPLPPAQNHLALAVQAGEKRYAGGHP
jgi:hypothetical protein